MKDIKHGGECHESVLGCQAELLSAVLKHNRMELCEYFPAEDKLLIYDEKLSLKKEIPGYLEFLPSESRVHPDDRWKVHDFCLGKIRNETEVRVLSDGGVSKTCMQVLHAEKIDLSSRLLFSIRDITSEKDREALLEEHAKKDSLTMLYNLFWGRELINEYLSQKDPYSTCGIIVADIDYFKYANDTYGHLFGNQVLIEIAHLFQALFDKKDVIMRAGGDEFVILLKDISHTNLVKKSMQLIEAVRQLSFEGKDFSITCSAGVCFLMENVSGYTYDQLFENADWALYKAKENGRNCYVFCDNLQRFEIEEREPFPTKNDINFRYLHNDIISTAFEIFEKTSSFSVAVRLLMEVIGYRFGLDRITIIQTDIKERNVGRQYQWRSDTAPEVLGENSSFSKEDFLTLFQSYDENKTTVLQSDHMGMYSPEGAALLMQGEAKTVLYAAMYCEGKYTGAISYVVCREKRHWSRKNRKELGEVTKIISAHLARSQTVNQENPRSRLWTEYDSLTGLLSFSRFHMDAEHLIVGGYAASYIMIYSDLLGFKYFNHRYGYSAGDQLLKEFGNFLAGQMKPTEEVYLSRVIADQFLMLAPYDSEERIIEHIDRYNKEFERIQSEKYPDTRIRIRTGVYVIEPDCISASYAIDAANYARRQINRNSGCFVRLYDQELKKQQQLESEIINGIDKAMQEKRFQIHLQPKISLKDQSVSGAEALVRWKTEDGTLLFPDSFIPLCESSGRIEELDYYVFELVAQFLAKNQKLGRKQIPISVNASILHASDPMAVQKYLDILERYQVDPQYIEIELTETETVEEHENARRWFQELRKAGIHSAMDDFGAGYSVLNSIIDIPVDTVKLDRAFVKNCASNDRAVFFLKKMIDMIQGLGYHVICEGVETREQFRLLQEAGCEEGQGYLFSKPMSIEEYEKFVYSNDGCEAG